MKTCELCKSLARTYCESDQANLCWNCDARVHAANFIVSRHSRSLLCHACQSPTPWTASGSKLGRTISVCERCAIGAKWREGREEVISQERTANEIDVEDHEDEEEEVDGGDDDGDTQVVPWNLAPNPPAASSSSSGGDYTESISEFPQKRRGENASSSRYEEAHSNGFTVDDEATSIDYENCT